MSGAMSGVMPAHGASSSHDSRSPTTASPAAARTASITWRANSSRSCPHSSPRWLVRPDEELAHQAVLAGVDLDAVAAGVDRDAGRGGEPGDHRLRCRRPPSTSAPRGCSPRAPATAPTAALAVGAAALAAGVVERGDHQASVRVAGGGDRRPSGARSAAASGARSYGQSLSCTLAPSVTMMPQPPAARRS